MASFRKRGSTWRAEVWANGVRESATFPGKAQAIEWAKVREGELSAKKLGRLPRKTLLDALNEYSRQVAPKHRGARWEQLRLAKMGRDMECAGTLLADLEPKAIAKWRDTRLGQVAAASVARELQLLRAVLEVARREWGWIHASPAKEVKKPAAGRPRQRRIQPDEIQRLLLALGYVDDKPVTTISQRVALVFLLAIETAMRCGEMCSLTADQVYLDRRFVHLDKTKNGDERDVPLSAEAIRVFKRLPGGVPGVTPAQVDALFRKAKKAAGIAGLHFHDSRAEALTRLAAKVDVLTLARISGHRDLKSLQIYYRPTAEQIAAML